MIVKTEQKKKAIEMRRDGKTYGEILSEVKVAKSTLSIWLRDVGLAKEQKQRLTEFRILSQKKGAEARRTQRLAITKEIFELAQNDVTRISKNDLWLIGVILYWAEGSKQKDWNTSQMVQFTNSDPVMVKMFLKWLTECLKIKDDEITLGLAIHENNKFRLKSVVQFWNDLTGNRWPISDRVYFKRHNPSPKRHNLGELYYGTMRVTVRASVNLNRKIDSWVKGICNKIL